MFLDENVGGLGDSNQGKASNASMNELESVGYVIT